jgi:hypothetical protein
MMFYVPGIKTSLEAIGAIAGTQKICEEMLRKGNLIAIYPGLFYACTFFKIFVCII